RDKTISSKGSGGGRFRCQKFQKITWSNQEAILSLLAWMVETGVPGLATLGKLSRSKYGSKEADCIDLKVHAFPLFCPWPCPCRWPGRSCRPSPALMPSSFLGSTPAEPRCHRRV